MPKSRATLPQVSKRVHGKSPPEKGARAKKTQKAAVLKPTKKEKETKKPKEVIKPVLKEVKKDKKQKVDGKTTPTPSSTSARPSSLRVLLQVQHTQWPQRPWQI